MQTTDRLVKMVLGTINANIIMTNIALILAAAWVVISAASWFYLRRQASIFNAEQDKIFELQAGQFNV